MSGGEVVRTFPPRRHDEHPGIFWAGDRDEAWCRACGQPGATRHGERGGWHRYAAHIVECPSRDAGWVVLWTSCDWGECDEPSIGIRHDPEHGYLPVCASHIDGTQA